MRFSPGALAVFLVACLMLPAQMGPQLASKNTLPATSGGAASTERLTYDIEWRLIHAGIAVVESERKAAKLKLESAGVVSSLYKVQDSYLANYEEPFCATSSLMDAQEGKHHRETRVTYDRTRNRADFLERDLLKNIVIKASGVATPNCVHDALGALINLRDYTLEPGKSIQVPVSDGLRSASVKIEAQEREVIRTLDGSHQTLRCEAYLMNGVVYTRKGRVLLWLSDDARRVPVQIQLRMQFPIGTVTLHLMKEERS